jgi:hypothetical protein
VDFIRIKEPKSRCQVTKVSNPNVSSALTSGGLIPGGRSGSMEPSERPAMRIASSSTHRIAAGLLLAVLLSVVGYQVVRRLNSQGPVALLKRAGDLSWLNNWIHAKPLYQQAKNEFIQSLQFSKGLTVRVNPLSALIESSTSLPDPHLDLKVDWLVRLRSCAEHVCRVQAITLAW